MFRKAVGSKVMESKRNTIQRRLILNAMRELDMHATAEQVYEHVVKKHSSISKATVYRNLGLLAESGELKNIGSIYGSSHYDHNCHNHYHFVCEECKRIFDIEDYLPTLCNMIKNTDGFEIKGHSLSFNGFCRDCSVGQG